MSTIAAADGGVLRARSRSAALSLQHPPLHPLRISPPVSSAHVRAGHGHGDTPMHVGSWLPGPVEEVRRESSSEFKRDSPRQHGTSGRPTRRRPAALQVILSRMTDAPQCWLASRPGV